MHLLLTICSADKDPSPEPLPAWKRYRSTRISELYRRSHREGLPLYILSGKLGLVAAEDMIPFYDHRLTMGEVAGLGATLAQRLQDLQASEVTFVARSRETPGWSPYWDVVERACETVTGVRLIHENLS